MQLQQRGAFFPVLLGLILYLASLAVTTNVAITAARFWKSRSRFSVPSCGTATKGGAEVEPTLVPYLTAAGLMDAYESGRFKPQANRITPIIHQTVGGSISEVAATLRRTWARDYGDFAQILWSDHDNYELFRRFLPQYLAGYERLPSPITQADVARNAYMSLFGGICTSNLIAVELDEDLIS